MNRRRTIWAIVLLALLFTGAAPHSRASWQCEGRTCSTTAWACCCRSAEATQDGNCQSSGAPASDAASCATECGCVLRIEAAHVACAATAPAMLSPNVGPILLAPAPVALDTNPRSIVTAGRETRGPPLPRPRRLVPSLRAPPAA